MAGPAELSARSTATWSRVSGAVMKASPANTTKPTRSPPSSPSNRSTAVVAAVRRLVAPDIGRQHRPRHIERDDQVHAGALELDFAAPPLRPGQGKDQAGDAESEEHLV